MNKNDKDPMDLGLVWSEAFSHHCLYSLIVSYLS